jgi:hypothetical protein
VFPLSFGKLVLLRMTLGINALIKLASPPIIVRAPPAVRQLQPTTAAPIATGWNEPVPGWDSHPLWTKRLFTAHADHLINGV